MEEGVSLNRGDDGASMHCAEKESWQRQCDDLVTVQLEILCSDIYMELILTCTSNSNTLSAPFQVYISTLPHCKTVQKHDCSRC